MTVNERNPLLSVDQRQDYNSRIKYNNANINGKLPFSEFDCRIAFHYLRCMRVSFIYKRHCKHFFLVLYL